MKIVYLISVLLLIHAVNAKPLSEEEEDYDEQDYEGDDGREPEDEENYDTDDEEEDIPNEPPVIDSKPSNFMAKGNETLYLPCNVRNGEKFVIMWKKNNKLIYQDMIPFGDQVKLDRLKQKLERMKNGTLVIKNADPSDNGEYACIVLMSSDQNINVTHNVLVESPPVITSLDTADGNRVLKPGDTLDLTCNATGFPEPKIQWYFKSEKMDIVGKNLLIENIGRDAAGDYRCLADNKIGRPGHETISIQVIHKPQINIEKFYQEGQVHELKCVVHAFPEATVSWKKDRKEIDPQENIIIKHKGPNNHRLIFSKFGDDDFGQYSCIAKNRVGEVEELVNVDRMPDPAVIHTDSRRVGKETVLVWTTHSLSAITDALIRYKSKEEQEWREEKVAVPDLDRAIQYRFKHTFAHLPPGRYVAKLKTKNQYGWSKFSHPTDFLLEGHHPHHHNNKKHHISFNEVPEGATTQEDNLHAGASQDSHILLKDWKNTDQSTESSAKEKDDPTTAGQRVSSARSLIPAVTLTIISVFSLLA